MTAIASRVTECFLTVFPGLAAEDVAGASQASLPQWDSLAHVTLLSALSEEFQIELDDDSFESLTSYSLVIDFVESRVDAGGSSQE